MRYLVAILLLVTSFAYGQWNDCPRGEVNCPGRCGRFVDSTGDGICDRSQMPPHKAEPVITQEPLALADPVPQKHTHRGPPSYHLIEISSSLVALYALTRLMAKFRLIKLGTQRQIWNSILLLGFLASATLGIVMLLPRGLISMPFNTLYWHVETGIVMATAGLLHAFWHWRYFARIFS